MTDPMMVPASKMRVPRGEAGLLRKVHPETVSSGQEAMRQATHRKATREQTRLPVLRIAGYEGFGGTQKLQGKFQSF